MMFGNSVLKCRRLSYKYKQTVLVCDITDYSTVLLRPWLLVTNNFLAEETLDKFIRIIIRAPTYEHLNVHP